MEPVLTVRQPWASAIFLAGKDVENRGRQTPYRGRLWIHAGEFKGREEADRWASRRERWLPEEPLPRGVILGCVELVDCVASAASPWAMTGEYHWILARPMLLRRAAAHKGQLGMTWRRPPRGELVRSRKSKGPTGLHKIFGKTSGHCHFCGDPLVFERRGWSDKQDGHWEIDHVTQRKKGGGNTRANSLPCCTLCNRLRWARTGDGLRELLLMGLAAVDEIKKGSQVGEELELLRDRRLANNELQPVQDRLIPTST